MLSRAAPGRRHEHGRPGGTGPIVARPDMEVVLESCIAAAARFASGLGVWCSEASVAGVVLGRLRDRAQLTNTEKFCTGSTRRAIRVRGT